VDNASTDESVRAAREWPGVQVLESPTNRGFAAANNAGIRRSVGKTLLLLNPDTIVPPAAIDRLVTELGNHPDAGAIGPRLIDANGRAELSFGSMIAPLAELKQRRLMQGLERGDPAVRSQVDAMTRQEQWPDWVSGACLLVRRRDAEAVGLLDERYVMYTEDVDFCAALRARGRRVLFTPAVEVVHLRGRSAATAPDATRAAYRRSHLAFYQKHHPALAPFLRLYHWLRPL
jgi:GT2 family glycosyltransferase